MVPEGLTAAVRLRFVILGGLMAAVTAVCSLIAIPNPFLPTVPFTLQVFAVVFAGLLLPPGWAFAAEAVYLFLGVIGLPVFAGGAAGAGVLFTVTGGFLWAYPPAAAACSALAGNGRVSWRLIAGGIAAIAIIYALGFAGMVVFGHLPADGKVLLGLMTFLPWDVAKAVVAAAIATRVRAAVLRSVPA